MEDPKARKKASQGAATRPKFDAFQHPEATGAMRPDVGTKAAPGRVDPPGHVAG
jgi:hypothetical protein